MLGDIKEEIATYQKELIAAETEEQKAEKHYKLAMAFIHDQEVDKAFQHFLQALKCIPSRETPQMSEEEKTLYEAALADYLAGAGNDPVRIAKQMLEKYAEQADAHPDWIHLQFLMATAYANLDRFEDFFERFYLSYPYLGETFLAYKTRGILYLRLSQHGRSFDQRHAYQEEALHYLTVALNQNPKDASLYKVLIFLSKDEKNDTVVLHYLQKMIENETSITRGDIYLYVREAVALGEYDLGQQIIDLARKQYDFSRAISSAQEYLNQCRGQ